MKRPPTVNIVCANAPRRVPQVPAVRYGDHYECSYCGRRVRVIA